MEAEGVIHVLKHVIATSYLNFGASCTVYKIQGIRRGHNRLRTSSLGFISPLVKVWDTSHLVC